MIKFFRNYNELLPYEEKEYELPKIILESLQSLNKEIDEHSLDLPNSTRCLDVLRSDEQLGIYYYICFGSQDRILVQICFRGFSV